MKILLNRIIFPIALFLITNFCFSAPPKVIVIDPGHGGKDPGATFKGVNEKDVTLAIGLLVQEKLQKRFPNIKTEITRNTDVFEHVTEKAEKANKMKGELFVSIHVNSSARNVRKYKYVNKPYYVTEGGVKVKKYKKIKQYFTIESYNNNADGVETYIWASDRSNNKSEAISSAYENYEEEYEDQEDIPDLNTPEAKLISKIYAQKFFQSSFRVATLIDEELIKIGRVSRGVKQRDDKGIWVLQATAMPAVLVEVGYLTHKEEAAYISSSKGQEEIAEAIAHGIARYVEP